MFFIFSALRHITFCGVFFALHYVFVSIAVLCFVNFVFCFFAWHTLESCRRSSLRWGRLAGLGLRQILLISLSKICRFFLSIICSYHCRLLSLSIIGNSKAFTAPMVVLVLFYSVVTSVNVDIWGFHSLTLLSCYWAVKDCQKNIPRLNSNFSITGYSPKIRGVWRVLWSFRSISGHSMSN